MREEIDITIMSPGRTACRGKQKQQVTINLFSSTIDYFKLLSAECGIPYQTLINLYLDQCVSEKKQLWFI